MILVHRCVIVPEALASTAAYLTGQATPAGAGMFVQGLGADGEPTHRFSNGLISDEFSGLLPLDEWDEDSQQYVRTLPGDVAAIVAISEGAATEGQVQALLDAAVCTADTWTVMVARLGLRPVDQQEDI